jgi:DNA-binding PadR family transcriptional regulator
MKHFMHKHHDGQPRGRGREDGRVGDPREDGHHRHGRGRRRVFESGELRLVLLLLMEGGPRHGYDLIREFESRANGAYSPSPGVVYPTLTLLEDIGQVECRAAEGARKVFTITPAGREHLAARRAEAEAALGRLDALAREGQALGEGPVRRAMTNLKTALRDRLSGAPDRDLLLSVADAIDDAARKIERL